MNKLTYAYLPDEDKLLMDGLFQLKAESEAERKILRDIIARLRKREMECTKDIMNLSQRAIGEKFDLGVNSAKPLTNKNRKELLNKKPADEVKKVDNVKTIRSTNGHKSRKHSRGVTQNSLYIC